MKIVNKYRGLKRWAKRLFVVLLVISLVSGATGVGTIFAYADPAGSSSGEPAGDPDTGGDPADPAADPTDPDDDGEGGDAGSGTGNAGNAGNTGGAGNAGDPADPDNDDDPDGGDNTGGEGGGSGSGDNTGGEGGESGSGDNTGGEGGESGGSDNNGGEGGESGSGNNDGGNNDGGNNDGGEGGQEGESTPTPAQTPTPDPEDEGGDPGEDPESTAVPTATPTASPVPTLTPSPTATPSPKKDDGDDRNNTMGITADAKKIPIRYNGSSKSKDSYLGKVTITAEGYKISDNENGPFSSSYVFDTVGKDQNLTLWFRNSKSGNVTKVTLTGITIVEYIPDEDGKGPSGKITVGDYSSKKVAATKDTVLLTNTEKKIVITANDEGAGIDAIEYFVSEKYYASRSDIEGTVTDGKAAWKTYYKDGKPTFPENTAGFVYARIIDGAGNVTYLSTGKIIYDTEEPKISKIVPAKKNDSTVVAIAGSDNLSGISKVYLKYAEKKDGEEMKEPDEDDIIENGMVADAQTIEKLKAGATFNLPVLDQKKLYVFYAVAKDKVGNISAVKKEESKGTGKGTVSDNDLSEDEKNGSGSGLTPAPNGIAGSGSGNAAAKPSGGEEKKADAAKASPSPSPASAGESALEREIKREPYIADATGSVKIGRDATEGWDRITPEIVKADPGSVIDIDMSGLSLIPGGVFATMKERNVSVRFRMPQDVVWTVKGDEITADSFDDMDLGVSFGSDVIPAVLLKDTAGSNPHADFVIRYDGDFGFPAILSLPAKESYEGMFASLYYFDPKTKELSLAGVSKVDASARTEFRLEHASSYSVIYTEERTLAEMAMADNEELLSEYGDGGIGLYDSSGDVYRVSSASGFSVPDLFGLRGKVRIWLFVICIICGALCIGILFMPGLKIPEYAENRRE